MLMLSDCASTIAITISGFKHFLLLLWKTLNVIALGTEDNNNRLWPLLTGN
jgi:hypothetical protein